MKALIPPCNTSWRFKQQGPSRWVVCYRGNCISQMQTFVEEHMVTVTQDGVLSIAIVSPGSRPQTSALMTNSV